jgi:hypothetical protein
VLRRAIAVTIGSGTICVSAFAVGGGPAFADPGLALAECDQSEPGCTATAGSVTTVRGSGGKKSESGQGSRRQSTRTCTSAGLEMPCSIPELGTIRADGCYYARASGPPDPAFQTAVRSPGPGAWFDRTCVGGAEIGATTVWLPGGTAAAIPAPPPPIVIARQAVDRLVLPRPQIGVNPVGEQLVSLPTWLWLDRDQWQPRSATASVPGISVTVTATPARVEWSMGDGMTVTCEGSGTPFPVSGDPRAASPDCGHTYTRSSAGLSNEAFPVTARVFWRIAWSGGGEAGSLPDLQTTSSTALRVAESQALVTGGGAG